MMKPTARTFYISAGPDNKRSNNRGPTIEKKYRHEVVKVNRQVENASSKTHHMAVQQNLL